MSEENSNDIYEEMASLFLDFDSPQKRKFPFVSKNILLYELRKEEINFMSKEQSVPANDIFDSIKKIIESLPTYELSAHEMLRGHY